MDAGPAKMRKKGQRPDTLSLSFIMTDAELVTLNTFIQSIAGTARFYFTHPRTNATIEARYVPGQDGQLYTVQHVTQDYSTVQFQLEVLP
jgi:phage-related protein